MRAASSSAPSPVSSVLTGGEANGDASRILGLGSAAPRTQATAHRPPPAAHQQHRYRSPPRPISHHPPPCAPSLSGNSNTVGGGLVYPRADVGQFQGWVQDNGEGKKIEMIDGKGFFGAKAYKDSKVCNMMTVSELHRRYHDKTGITFSSLYPGCIAETALFREKRQWFRKGFPLFMKYVTGGYVSEQEAGERLAQVIDDDLCKKSGVYWSWNGNAKQVGLYDPKTKTVSGAGGSGGEIFENDQSNQVTDIERAGRMFDLSSKLCGVEWPEFK